MKSLKEYYLFLLHEDPEAPANSIFGQYLFAPNRDDTPDPKERNTAQENNLESALRSYIMGNSKGKLSQLAGILLNLVNQGLYRDALDPSQYKKAFRVLQVPWTELPTLLNLPREQVKAYGVTGPNVLNPKDFPISGWTTQPQELIKVGDVAPGTAVALFVASVEGNRFFGNPGRLAQFLGLPEYVKEMETIAVGPVRYQKAVYIIFTQGVLQAGSKDRALAWLMQQVLK